MNLDAARRYVEALAWGAPMTWQTFDDSGQKRPGLVRVLHGRLDELAPELARLNDAGAGIFATVNATDGRGRCASNVVALRSLFADDDGGGLRSYPIPPCFVVHSAHGPHPYWLLRKGEPLERFGAAQKQIAAALHTDSKVCDLPRVMRVPGFTHRKGEPAQVTIETGHIAKRYTIDEVLAAFPDPRPAAKPMPVPPQRRWCHRAERDGWWRTLRRGIAVGQRNWELFRLACRISHDGFALHEVRAALMDLNARLCSEPLTEREIEEIARNASKYGGLNVSNANYR